MSDIPATEKERINTAAIKFAEDNKVLVLARGMKVNMGPAELVVENWGDEMLVLRRLPGSRIMGIKQFSKAFGSGHVS